MFRGFQNIQWMPYSRLEFQLLWCKLWVAYYEEIGMKLEAFFEAVEADENLQGVGVNGHDTYVQEVQSKIVTRVPLDLIEMSDWSDMCPILIGAREPIVLKHITRVVGYFSQVANWNRSKIGELKDRHKGDYAIKA